MPSTIKADYRSRQLREKCAGDLMTPNPQSLRATASVREAIIFLTDKGYSAAPVIDDSGRPIGVLSRSDLITHEREKPRTVAPTPDYYSRSDLVVEHGESISAGIPADAKDRTPIRDLMTPVVFSVTPDAPARRVVEDMVAWKVHRLFVVGPDGVLVGVISALDVMRHLLESDDLKAADR
jgi:CBS domain-containing protein